LYRCHFKRHHGIACILITTTAINSLRVNRWGTDLFPLETQRGPSGRREKWEGKERKGRKGKGRKSAFHCRPIPFSLPSSNLVPRAFPLKNGWSGKSPGDEVVPPPLLSLFAAYRLGPVSDSQFLVCYIASRVRVNCLL